MVGSMAAGTLALGLAGVVGLPPGESTQARAAVTYEDFVACSGVKTSGCIVSAEADVAGTGTFAPLPADVVPFAIRMRSPGDPSGTTGSLLFGLKRTAGARELAPALTAASFVRLVVDVGDLAPTRFGFSSADVASWTHETAPGGTRRDTIIFRPAATTTGSNCSTSSGCDAPTGVTDTALQATATLSETPATTEPQKVFDQQADGAWVATNASAYTDAFLDSATGSLAVQVAAPHLTAAGAQNTGFVSGFVPDALVTGFFNTTPEALATKGVLTSSEGTAAPAAVTATIERVTGGVRFEASGFHFSSPTFRLAVRRTPRIGLAVTPARDAVGVRRFTASGRLSSATRLTASTCAGKVAVTMKAGRRLLATGRATVAFVNGACRYSKVLTVKDQRSARSARVSARYLGTPTLAPASAPAPRVVKLV